MGRERTSNGIIWYSFSYQVFYLVIKSIEYPFYFPGYVIVQRTVFSTACCTSVSPQGVPTFHAAMSSAESVKFSTKRCFEGDRQGVAKDRAEICTVIGCYSERGPACVGQHCVYLSQSQSQRRSPFRLCLMPRVRASIRTH